jgi:LuxR family maltose regulon positive regulatory protein
MTLCDLAGLQRLQGNLHQATATYREALQLAQEFEKRSGRELPIVGYVYGRMSTVLTEMNDGAAAVQLARKGVELCKAWGFTETLVDCFVYLAIAQAAAGDWPGAREAIREAKQAAEMISPWYSSVVDLFEARIHLSQGEIASASTWAAKQRDRFSTGDEPDTRHAAMYLTMIQILATEVLLSNVERGTSKDLVKTELERAQHSFDALLNTARSEGQMMREIEIMITQALTSEALGQTEQALIALGRALRLAEPEGYVRIFVSKGAPLAILLQRAIAKEIEPAFADRILRAFKASESSDDQPTSGSLPEPLTQRELEVLSLIAAGLSNRQIAAELFLAVGTVKKYTSNIYGKLEVHRRTQAVSRAREIGLL